MSIRLWIVGDSEVNPVVEAISALGAGPKRAIESKSVSEFAIF
jgi:hypothetical protein